MTGPLTDNGDRVLLTTNFSVATPLNGCIRNLVASNGTTLIGGDYQVNSTLSSLTVGGLPDPGAFGPISITAPVNSIVPYDLGSINNGFPWDIALSLTRSVPGTAGGLTTPGGQFLNVDFTDPTFTSLFNLSFSNAFLPATGLPFSSPTPLLVSGQMAVIDPGSVDGFALSHVNEIEIVTCDNPENFDSATTGTPGVFPPCWTDGGGVQSWRVHSGGTTSGNTGPTGDNTTGAANYMYCETSSPSVTGDTYILNAPPAQLTGGAVEFAYHMYGATVGTLELQER